MLKGKINSGKMLNRNNLPLEARRESFPQAIVKTRSEDPTIVGAPILCSHNSEPARRTRFQSPNENEIPFTLQSGSLNDSVISVSSAASFQVGGGRCHNRRIVMLENLQAEQVRMNGRILKHIQNQESLLELNRNYTDEKTNLLQHQMDVMDENYGQRILNLETFVQNESSNRESRAQGVPMPGGPTGQLPPDELGPRNMGCSVTRNNVRSSRDGHRQSTAAGAGARIDQLTKNEDNLCRYCGKRMSQPRTLKTHQQWWCKTIPRDAPLYVERMTPCEYCQKEIHKLVMPSHHLTCKSRPLRLW